MDTIWHGERMPPEDQSGIGKYSGYSFSLVY